MLHRAAIRSVQLAAAIALFGTMAHARPFRVQQVPNGATNGCLTCHLIPGGPRNPFGSTIESGFLDVSGNVQWGPALAAIDSDNDGRTNGAELLDSGGVWVTGQPNPGLSKLVSAPGTPDSVPSVPATSLFGTLLVGCACLLAGGSRLRRELR